MEQQFENVVKPRNGWFDIDVKEIFRYRDLIGLFVKRDFVSLYKQTILGPLWAVIQPFLTTVVFTVVFGNLAGLAADGCPSFLFYFSGTIVWQYFSTCLTQTADTFVTNSSIMGKVYFPRLVMPISTVFTNLISFCIQFGMFILFFLYYLFIAKAIHPTFYMILLPLLVLQMAMLGLGAGIIVSSLTTKYRDLRMLITFGVQLWMYGTPVAYDLAIIPQKLLPIYMINPMTQVVVAFRKGFLNVGTFDLKYYLIGWATTICILFIGVILFSRVEKTFMDTI